MSDHGPEACCSISICNPNVTGVSEAKGALGELLSSTRDSTCHAEDSEVGGL